MELFSVISFWLFAVLVIITSLLTVFMPKVFHSILFGFITFILIGLSFFLLKAPFNAAAQISIYAVAFSILFVMAVMLYNSPKDEKKYLFVKPRLFITLSGILLIICSVVGIVRQDRFFGLSEFLNNSGYIISQTNTSLNVLANTLFTKYIFVFELLSVLLLFGVAGIIVFVNKNPKIQEGRENE